ncbi:MAG: protoheme IX farnesyltransferase [bacterium]|nr:protoheme IX farnesyltransferase [bacterium]
MTIAEPAVPEEPGRSRAHDIWELTKPRITFLVAVTAAMGFVLGSSARVDWLACAWTVVGTALVSAGASAFNHHGERRIDALMERTRNRPLPAGRLEPWSAIVLGLGASAAGIVILGWQANPLAALLGAVALVSYVWVYTPLKRVSHLSTLVGAVPGALPPMMGWAAASGGLGPGAWALFAILFLWQLPHFMAIAWMCRNDYARAGLPMLPVVEPDGGSTARQAVLYAAALVPVSLLPTVLGVTGSWYLGVGLLLSLGLLGTAVGFARSVEERTAKRLLLASVVYLPALCLGLVLNRIV